MNWRILENLRVLGAEYVPIIEKDIKRILGEKVFSILEKAENKTHPWHIASKEVISGGVIDLSNDLLMRFYSQAAEFLYFYTVYYNDKQRKIARNRISSKDSAESLIFEHRVGINFIWMKFYEVEATNIDGAYHDFLLKRDRITIGVECSIKIESYDFDHLLRKMEEKTRNMRDDIPYFLAIHVPEATFKGLFGSDTVRTAFGSRLQGKFKNNEPLGKINKILFSVNEYLNLGFHNPNTNYNLPDDFPLTGNPDGILL